MSNRDARRGPPAKPVVETAEDAQALAAAEVEALTPEPVAEPESPADKRRYGIETQAATVYGYDELIAGARATFEVDPQFMAGALHYAGIREGTREQVQAALKAWKSAPI